MNKNIKREEIIKRFLYKNEIIIQDEDYEFLSNFKNFKDILDANRDVILYWYDSGNDYSTTWTIAKKEDNTYYKLSSLSHKAIVNKVNEIYPEVKVKKEKKDNKHIVDSCFNFGKYKGKTIEWVEKNDLSYLNWCIENIKNFKQQI